MVALVSDLGQEDIQKMPSLTSLALMLIFLFRKKRRDDTHPPVGFASADAFFLGTSSDVRIKD